MGKKIEITSEMIQEMIQNAIREHQCPKPSKQVKLSEQEMREFISYSVARILKEEVLPREKNKDIMFHAYTKDKKHERTPEEKERDEHLFDDDYWVEKMKKREKEKEEAEDDEVEDDEIAGI